MQIDVRIENLNKIRTILNMYPAIAGKNIQKAIDKTGNLVHRETKQNIRSKYTKRPFDTGHMWRSIRQKRGALKTEIWPDVNYAIYPHEGWSTSRSYGRRPFLEDAIVDNKEEINKYFHKAVKDSLDTIGRMA